MISFVAIWTLMMVAMMAPSVLPTVRLYAATRPYTTVFVTGYFAAWAAVGVVVAAGRDLLPPLAEPWRRLLPAAGLLLAGMYQLTRWKRLCLTHCRTPMQFFLQHWRAGIGGALLMGAHHGLYCVGCCAGLMTALVILGMMNPVWMVAVALVVLVEKTLPFGERITAPVGVALIALGVAVAGGWLAPDLPMADDMMRGM